MAKNNNTDTQAFKVKALSPIVNEWNEVINDRWEVVKDPYGTITIKSKDEQVYSGYKGIHGILLTRIAEVANQYGWTFGIHFTETSGLYLLVN